MLLPRPHINSSVESYIISEKEIVQWTVPIIQSPVQSHIVSWRYTPYMNTQSLAYWFNESDIQLLNKVHIKGEWNPSSIIYWIFSKIFCDCSFSLRILYSYSHMFTHWHIHKLKNIFQTCIELFKEYIHKIMYSLTRNSSIQGS